MHDRHACWSVDRLRFAFAEQTHRLESLARHLDAATATAKAEAMAASLSAEVLG